MSISVTDAWRAAMSVAEPAVRYHVRIWTNRTTSHDFVDGACDHADFDHIPESVAFVSTVGRASDPMTHRVTSKDLEVTMHLDGLLRSLIVSNGVIGAWVEVRLGEASLALADFTQIAGLMVDDIEIETGSVTLRCKTPESKLRDVYVAGSWIAAHPLEAAKDIIESSVFSVDAPAFAPATYAGSISHYVVTNCAVLTPLGGATGGVTAETNAAELLDEIAQILDGAFVANDSGEITFKRFDTTAAAVAHWTEDDISDFDVVTLYGNLTNVIDVLSHSEQLMAPIGSQATSGGYYCGIRRQDRSSQTRFGLVEPGVQTWYNRFHRKFETRWVSGGGNTYGTVTAVSPGVGDTLHLAVTGANLSNWGICGTRWPGFPAGAQPADAVPTTDRLVYLEIDSEIIACDAVTIPGVTARRSVQYFDAATSTWATANVPDGVGFRVAQRGALGTTATSHVYGSAALDVTMQVALADAKLARFANGCFIVSCRTDLSKMHVDLHDLVTLTTDRFVAHGHDGLNPLTKLEVIGKAIFPGHIEWELAYATQDTLPEATKEIAFRTTPNSSLRSLLAGAAAEESASLFVASGFKLIPDAGLGCVLSAGVVAGATTRSEQQADHPETLSPSKDTYIVRNVGVGGLSFIEQTAGSAPPTYRADQLPLWKITTDATAITATVDLRQYGAISARHLTGGATAQHGVFVEYFERTPDEWHVISGTGTVALVSTGQAGGKALQCTGMVWRASRSLIPYDPSKLYRMRCRVRMTQRDSTLDSNKERFYCGFVGVGADGATLVNVVGAAIYSSQHYYCAVNAHVYADAGNSLTAWKEYTSWIKGVGSVVSNAPSTDPTAPRNARTEVRYIRPLFICNHNAGNGVMELDYIAIDVQDEDGLVRSYQGLTSAGVVRDARVVSTSVASGAITTGAIAERAVGTHQQFTTSAAVGLGFNPDFRLRSRG
jgi:hypothetical protein